MNKSSDEPAHASSERIGVYASRIFREFLAAKNKDVNFQDFSKEDLDDCLRSLFLELRQKDGTPYQVRSLNTIRYGISRTLKLRNPPVDINNDPAFRKSSKAFSDISRTLRSQGFDKGNTSNLNHAIISGRDIRQLYLYWSDWNDPTKLQQKVWFELELFSLCMGKEDAKRVKKTIFSIMFDEERSRKYIRRDGKAFTNIRVYEQPGSPYCPVASFEIYFQRLNEEAEALFTVPLNTPDWYSAVLYGNNALLMMKRISVAARLSKKYPNSCVRATALKLSTSVERDGSLERNVAFQDFFYEAVVAQEGQEDSGISPPVTVYSNPPSPIEAALTLERPYSFEFEQVAPKIEIEVDSPNEYENEEDAPSGSVSANAALEERCGCSSVKDLLFALITKQTKDSELRQREFELRQHEVMLLNELVTIQKKRLDMEEKQVDSKRKKSDSEDSAFVEFVKAKLSKP